MLDVLFSTNGNNDSKYNNPAYDALMEKAPLKPILRPTSAICIQAEDLLMSDAACIPVAYYNDFYLCSDKGHRLLALPLWLLVLPVCRHHRLICFDSI